MKKLVYSLLFLSTLAIAAGEARFPKGIIGNLTGNASTATALSATPNACSAGQFATGIAANGNASCSAPTTASAVQDGYLSATDWGTFNGKEGALSAGTTLQYYRGDKSWATLNTAVVPESGNLYYTDARARAALSASGPVSYNTSTGAISVTQAGTSANGYLSSTDWNTFNGKQAALSAASASVNGYLSSTDWTTFNGKEGSLGTGTTVQFLRGDKQWASVSSSQWTTTGSDIYYSAGKVGVGTTAPAAAIHVVGTSGTTVKIVDGNQGVGKVLTSDVNGVASWSNPTSGSGINYITNYNGEADAAGWYTYNDCASAPCTTQTMPIDGTGGSANITWEVNNTNVLRGTKSFTFTKDDANRQGEGVGYAFSIDAADQGHTVNVSFDYSIYSGTYADDELSVWIYDVTNAALIQPAPSYIKNHSMPSAPWTGSFQAASNSTSYRLIVHVSGTSTSAYVLKFDNFITGPNVKNVGTPVTDWQSFTPTGSWSANTTYTGKWRKVGDSVEIQMKAATSGAPEDVALDFNLPSFAPINAAKLVESGTTTVLGRGQAEDNGVADYDLFAYYFGSTGKVVPYLIKTDVASAINNVGLSRNFPFSFGVNDFIQVTLRYPVLGWSAGTVMSSDAGNVPTVFHGNTTATTGLTSTPTAVALTATSDNKAGFSTATYTVKNADWLDVTGTVNLNHTTAGSNAFAAIYVNGAAVDTKYVVGAAGSPTVLPLKYVFRAKAGDTIALYVWNTSGTVSLLGSVAGAATTTLSVVSTTSNQQIAASDNVSIAYNTDGALSVGNGTPSATTMVFNVKEWDTHGAYNNATGIFTAPISGEYFVNASLLTTVNMAVSSNFAISIVKNSAIAKQGLVKGTGVSTMINAKVSGSVKLLAGETIKIQAQSDTASTLWAAPTYNFVEIRRTGNY